MSNETFRKYIDIINENSQNKITDNETRYQVIKAMGTARYYMKQVYPYFSNPDYYQKNPRELKNKLDIVTQALADVKRYDGVSGLWADRPDQEYRLINNAAVNPFVYAINTLDELIDNKQVDELKQLFVTAEASLLQTAQSIHKSMGGKETFTSYFKNR